MIRIHVQMQRQIRFKCKSSNMMLALSVHNTLTIARAG